MYQATYSQNERDQYRNVFSAGDTHLTGNNEMGGRGAKPRQDKNRVAEKRERDRWEARLAIIVKISLDIE
jgi:hypothetical protein